jgi:hypothetical protein
LVVVDACIDRHHPAQRLEGMVGTNLHICLVRGSWSYPSTTKEEALAASREEIVVEFVRAILIETCPCAVVVRVDATGIAIGVIAQELIMAIHCEFLALMPFWDSLDGEEAGVH